MNGARRVTKATLTEQLEEAVRTDIIEGVLVPGQRLRMSELTDMYRVSATPLREALQRLAAQNLVEIDPRLGASVTRISRSDLRDIYWLLEMLDVLALERSIELSGPAWPGRVEAAFARFRDVVERAGEGDAGPAGLEWSQAHRAFHAALSEGCDSIWLLRTISSLRDHSERYRMLSLRTGTRNTLEEHAEIMRAAVDRDKDAAAVAARGHLRATVEVLERTLSFDGDEQSLQVPAVGAR